MVYRVTENGEKIVCDVCTTDICSRCHVKFHNGIFCDNFKFQTMNSEMLLEWMHQDPENRKSALNAPRSLRKLEVVSAFVAENAKNTYVGGV